MLSIYGWCFIRLSSVLFFLIQICQLLIFCMDDQESGANLDYFLLCFLCNIIKVNHFLYCSIINLISSFFMYYFLACSLCFYWIDWWYSCIIVSTHCDLINFFSDYNMLLVSESFIWYGFLQVVYFMFKLSCF